MFQTTNQVDTFVELRMKNGVHAEWPRQNQNLLTSKTEGLAAGFKDFNRGWELSLFGKFGHHLQILVGAGFPNIWVMFN